MPMDRSFKPYSGVGVVTIHQRTAAGLPGVGDDMGECPSFKINIAQSQAEMKTSRDQSRGVAFRMAQAATGTVELQLSTISDAVLSLLTGGAWTDTAAGAAVTNQVLPSTVEVGQVLPLGPGNVTALTITDSTATPKTLALGTNYTADLFAGTITVTDLTTGGPFIQPLRAGYTPGAIRTLGALKAATAEWWLKFAGTNAYDGTRGLVDAYRVQFGADGDTQWIQEGYAGFALKGTIMRDTTKLATAPGGQYYAIRRP